VDVKTIPHVCVCICTYMRPKLLKQLLSGIETQITADFFSFSIVVVDNDQEESAHSVVSEFIDKSKIKTTYCCEPQQNIAFARNKAIENSKGDFLAFIDDDEFPQERWLLNHLHAFSKYDSDGILGPVLPNFMLPPPQWVKKGKFFIRQEHETGTTLEWQYTRTGNVFISSSVFSDKMNRFNSRFGSGGEDRIFFRELIEKGYKFSWCQEAQVYENIPPIRWNRSFMFRRALLRGQVSMVDPSDKFKKIGISIVAVIIYSLLLPFTFLFGQHYFMGFFIKLGDHLGRLFTAVGIPLIKEVYVTK